jgi:hypothetical protein
MNLFLVIFSTVIFLLFFVGGRVTSEAFTPVAGVIYTANNVDSSSASEMKITETPIFTNALNHSQPRGKELPIVNVIAEGNLPGEFIAHVSTSAAWRLVSRSTSEPKKLTQTKSNTPVIVETKKQPLIIQETPQQIVYSFPKLKEIVTQSQNTYFFTEKDQTIGMVKVTVQSSTPYQDKNILGFDVKNESSAYFFIENISILKDGQAIEANIYNKELVRPGQTIPCLALLQRYKGSTLILRLNESGGKHRVFEVKYETY